MTTAIDDTPLETEEKFFQKFFSMAKKAVRKEQSDTREPIYLTPDDYRDMGESLKRAGQKMVDVAAEMEKHSVKQMPQKAKQLLHAWVPWIVEFASGSFSDVEPTAYAQRRGVPSPKESNRIRYLRAKDRQSKSK